MTRRDSGKWATALPGTPHHQRVLAAIVDTYRSREDVLAVLLFGSRARGNWDVYSDLDLDVVLADGATVDAAAELHALATALEGIGEQTAALVPKAGGNGDVVLASLLQFSIRYHDLAATSPNIVDSLRLLWGRVPLEMVVAAGEANRESRRWDAAPYLGRALRRLVEVESALARGRLWFAVEALTATRDALIEAYGYARGAARPLHEFEAHADAGTRAALAAFHPHVERDEVEAALAAGIMLLRAETATLFAGTIELNAAQRAMLDALANRQARRRAGEHSPGGRDT